MIPRSKIHTPGLVTKRQLKWRERQIRILLAALVGAGISLSVTPANAVTGRTVDFLNGTNGFAMDGLTTNALMGYNVSGAGDVNGDGFDDIVAGANGAEVDGVQTGAAYVIYGKSAGTTSSLDLSSLNANTGFRIHGTVANGYFATAVASGDINGDGLGDLVISSPEEETTSETSGKVYVIFGNNTPRPIDNDVTSIVATDGFSVSLEGDFSYTISLSTGDINGDGFDDLIIGDAYDGPIANDGAVYVVFGKAAGLSGNIPLATLNGTNGFKITGEPGSYLGFSVDGAGDVNGDGKSDIVVGAYRTHVPVNEFGAAWIVPGKASSWNTTASITESGTRLNSEGQSYQTGRSVAGAGDVNGDGFDDVLVAAPYAASNGNSAGSAYVVFGRADISSTGTLDLSSLNGTNGFEIPGYTHTIWSSWIVSAAGDVNGDGFDDLALGCPYENPNGHYSGSSYIVFGKPDWSATSSLDLNAANATQAIRFDGMVAGDEFAYGIANAGDINHDGLDDVIIGAPYTDRNGYSAVGSAYLLYGSNNPSAANPDAWTLYE